MVRDVLRMYYSVISDLDIQVGRILDALHETDQGDNTIVIFTSDHGLGVGSHGIRGKQNMYEHTVGVPMIVAGPGVVGGRRSYAQVYLRDLYPTVCELAGVPIPETVEARSFADVLRARSQRGHDEVFCYFRDSQRMLRDDRWKVIYYPQLERWQLFDLRTDPNELRDLANDPRFAVELAKGQERLRAAMVSAGDPLVSRVNEDASPDAARKARDAAESR
jgi:arylsulfatase A-like enzyme